jgi:hypothetical protein
VACKSPRFGYSPVLSRFGREAKIMRRQRRGPALFELLQGDRSQRAELLQPPALRVVQNEPEDHEDEHDSDDTVSARSPGVAGAADAARPASVRREGRNHAHASVGIAPHAEGVVELDGGRLRVNLTPVTAAIAIFVICLVALAAFVVGQRWGDKAGFSRGFASGRDAYAAGTVDAVEAARNQPPATHLVTPLLEDAPVRSAGGDRVAEPSGRGSGELNPVGRVASTTAPAVAAVGWVRDLTYVVAQEFAAGREEHAQRAQAFLAERGIDSGIVRLDSGAMQLITLQGYNHKEPAQKKLADDLLKKERAAGAEYFATGGGYKLEGYYKTLKRDQW